MSSFDPKTSWSWPLNFFKFAFIDLLLLLSFNSWIHVFKYCILCCDTLVYHKVCISCFDPIFFFAFRAFNVEYPYLNMHYVVWPLNIISFIRAFRVLTIKCTRVCFRVLMLKYLKSCSFYLIFISACDAISEVVLKVIDNKLLPWFIVLLNL